MDENKISFNLGTLKHFINNSLGLDYERNKVTGFESLNSIINASAHNTYIETVGDKADTLYRRIKESPISMTTHAYLNYIKRLSAKLKLNEKEMKVRYFFFLFEQMLQTIWICFYKNEASFKEFLIEMANVSKRYCKVEG